MVSRTKLIVVTAIVALGLLGPMSFIAQSAAKNSTAVQAKAAPVSQSAPIMLTPVIKYSARVTGSVISIRPSLIVVLASNSTGSNLTAELSNFTNATLTSLRPQSGNYVATYHLNSSDALFNVLFGLSKRPISILQYGMPADVSFPPTFTAYRNGRAYNITIGASDSVTAIVTGTKQGGEANFTLNIVETGGKKKIVAVETS